MKKNETKSESTGILSKLNDMPPKKLTLMGIVLFIGIMAFYILLISMPFFYTRLVGETPVVSTNSMHIPPRSISQDTNNPPTDTPEITPTREPPQAYNIVEKDGYGKESIIFATNEDELGPADWTNDILFTYAVNGTDNSGNGGYIKQFNLDKKTTKSVATFNEYEAVVSLYISASKLFYTVVKDSDNASGSNNTNEAQLWYIPLAGGNPVKVTTIHKGGLASGAYIFAENGHVYVASAFGDACTFQEHLYSFDTNTLEMKDILNLDGGCTGENRLGITNDQKVIIGEFKEVAGGHDDYESSPISSVYYVNVASPSQKHELISEKDMPKNVESAAYDSNKNALILETNDKKYYEFSLATNSLKQSNVTTLPSSSEHQFYNLLSGDVETVQLSDKYKVVKAK